MMPGDFFRFTPDGASALFERAGLEVVAQRKIGNSMLSTAHLLGFGVADFDPAYLKRVLVRPFERRTMNTIREWMFLESAIVARKPPGNHSVYGRR